MAKAEVTLWGAKSYAVGKHKFKQGHTQLVTDDAVIQRCQATSGFSVQLLAQKPVRKIKPAEPVQPAADPEADPADPAE